MMIQIKKVILNYGYRILHIHTFEEVHPQCGTDRHCRFISVRRLEKQN
jgi:hypothetical protein